MQTKTLFDGRPRLDLALRILMIGSIVALLVASIATLDPRTGAAAVALAAFGARELFVLPEQVERASNLVFWGALAVWAFLAFG